MVDQTTIKAFDESALPPVTPMPPLFFSADIETTTEVEGAPASEILTDGTEREIKPGLDHRYGAIDTIAVSHVTPYDDARQAVGEVLMVDGTARWTEEGGTVLTSDNLAPGETAHRTFDTDGQRVTVAEFASERELLVAFVAFIASLNPADLVATWNGGVFDWVFIVERCNLHGIEHSIELVEDPSVLVKYETQSGYVFGCRVFPGRGRHLDIQESFAWFAQDSSVKHSLKPVGHALSHRTGVVPIEVDRENMHLLTAQERVEYGMSDSRVTGAILMEMWEWFDLHSCVDVRTVA
jgi:DNA polymerase elongation subunit (family B)